VFNSTGRLIASSLFISAQGENRASSREKFETGTITSRAEPTPLFDLNLQPSTSWIGRLRAETSWTTCRSLEMKLFGVAAMLDIGRISVRGSVKAHSSIYRRHSGAQGRSQHYKSGTGTLVESESWLAMADCLGRFGRASHSNPRYHSPTQNLGKSKCMSNAISCDPCHQIRLCFICTPSAILQDQLPFCSRPVERTRPLTVSSLVEYYKTCCLPSDQESLHAFRKPTLRVVQPESPSDPLCSRP
jgi:hypothetical protein